ncbi:MAG: tryptophan-rich sensory protein [Lachnospiraceae bacterium]|nr:tryptophan-rich sensory protein [Lachnospiraceae bacterium]
MMKMYEVLNKPMLAPPGWLFPIVWTILYTLMGISAYLILRSKASKEDVKDAMTIFYYQLLINLLWPAFFFGFRWYFFSFLWILLLIGFVITMIVKFYKIRKVAAYLNIPYLLWICFASYLNLAIWWLN